MATKAKTTKTINPLHFEDLEPHRFEDLVRRLLYNFKDWQNIEATGRAGSDEGFDVRAWEKDDVVTNVSDEGEEGMHALEVRLWQVQGKREKTITPAKMRTLIKEGVDQANPSLWLHTRCSNEHFEDRLRRVPRRVERERCD